MPTRTIDPIPNPAPTAVPSVLTVASSDSLLAAAFADDAVGWYDGVSFLDLGALPARGRALSECDWEWKVEPDGTGTGDDDPDTAYPSGLADRWHPDTVRFYPWEFHAAIGCDTLTPGEDYTALAEAAIDAQVARQVSRELWTGYYSRSHSLTRDAVEVTGGTPVSWARAFGLIQEAVAGAGTWHVPAILEAELRSAQLVIPNGNVPLGPGGWPVSFGPAYPRRWGLHSSPWRRDTTQAVHPPGGGPPESELPLADGETFIIGHRGRLEVAWQARPVDAPAAGRTGHTLHDLYTNAAEAIVRVVAIFRFNPSHVYAARVRLDGATGAAAALGEPVTYTDDTAVLYEGGGTPVYYEAE